MLSDWYFCTALQLPPQQSAAHLEILRILREAESTDLASDEVLTESIRMLTDAGPWRILHGLPFALGAQHARRERPITEALTACCAEVLDTCVRPSRSKDRLYELLQRLQTDVSPTGVAADLADRAAELLSKPPATPPSTVPYLDLTEFAVPTLVLIMLDALSRRDPSSIRGWCNGEDRPPWLTRALHGSYGRYALLLAVAATTRAGDRAACAALEAPGIGLADIEPDLMACYAWARFRLGGGKADAARRQLLDRLEVAAIAATQLPRPVPGDHPDAAKQLEDLRANVYRRMSGQAAVPPVFTAVIWHLTLWEMAADHDPEQCAARLERWWGVPPEEDEVPIAPGTPALNAVLNVQNPRRVHPTLVELLRLRSQQLHNLSRASQKSQQRRGSRDPRARVATPRSGPAWRMPRLWLEAGAADQTNPGVGATIWSPWTFRKSDAFWPGDNAEASLEDTLFPALREPISIIQLSAAAMLAVRLLRLQPSGTPPPPHLLALFVHAKDVLKDCRFRLVLGRFRNDADADVEAIAAHTLVPANLLGLLLQLKRVVDNAGKGSYPQIEPAAMTSFLLDRAASHRSQGEELRSQERKLYDRAGLSIAVEWIKEVTSGHGTASSPRPSERWFRTMPGTPQPALQVLATVARHGRGFPPPEAASLLQQLYPSEFAQLHSEKPDWNWLARRQALQQRFEQNTKQSRHQPVLNANAIVCAPPYAAQQWRDVTPQLAEWLTPPSREEQVIARYQHARTAMLAARLGVLLRESPRQTGDIEDWISEFIDRIRAMVTVPELAREVRAQLVSWIPIDGAPVVLVGDPQAQDRLERVLSAAIDAIIEFSWGAPRYILLLLEHLRATTLPQGMASDLQHRFLRGVFQHRWQTGSRALRHGPASRAEERIAAREIDRELSRFVIDMGDVRLSHLDATLGEAFVTLWHDVHTDPAARPEQLPLHAGDRKRTQLLPGMRLRNRASVLDRYRDVEIVYPMPVDVTEAGWPGKGNDPVRSFFDNPRPAAGVNHPVVLGVVCGVEVGAAHGGDNLVLNCGLGVPVRLPIEPGSGAAAGELLAVRMSRPDTSADWTAHSVLNLRPAKPLAGERRLAIVCPRPEFPWLEVKINGEDVYPQEADDSAALIRAAWDPDLSRAFSDLAPADPQHLATSVLARYDEEAGGWLPEDRELSQLLAAPAEPGTLELTYADQVIDELGIERWRMVTKPGHSYVMTAEDWADPAAVRQQLATDPAGIRLHARVDRAAGRLVLVPDPSGRVSDDRNCRWRLLFADVASEYDAVPTASGWVAAAPAPPGFPAEIPVDGLPSGGGDRNLFFEVEAWTEAEWRRGRVRGAPLSARGLADPLNPSAARLRELRNIERDQVLELEGVIHFVPERPAIVRGPNGITLNAELQSLSLLALAQTDRPRVNGRKARVVSIRHIRERDPQTPIPMTDDELAEALARSAAVSGSKPPNLTSLGELTGAVVHRLKPHQRGGARALFGIWLQVGGEVRYCEVPESAFGVRPLWPGIGDPLTAQRQAMGWVFNADRRSITVRARYEVVPASAIPDKLKRTVGYDIDGQEVVQHLHRPLLAYRRSGAAVRSRFERWLSEFAVNQVGSPFGTNLSRQSTSLVRTSASERRYLSGFTVAYSAEMQEATVRGSLIRAQEVSRNRLEVDREFLCNLRPRTRAVEPAQSEVDQFRKREARGGPLVVAGTLIPGGLRLGTVARRPDGAYDRLMPQAAGDHPFIDRDPDDPYPGERVRALLVPDGDGYSASCRDAPPLTLRELLGELGAPVAGRDSYYRMPPQFGYVGIRHDEDGPRVHVFEWGLGWTVEVPDSQLDRRTEGGRLLALFHGDHIRGVTLTAGEQPVMRLSATDILPGLPARLYQEARKDVVHELEVEVDPAAGTVKVSKVLQGHETGRGSRAAQPRLVQLPRSAHLKSASRDMLLEVVRAPGTHHIFATLNQVLFKDRRAGQGRSLQFVYVPATASRDGQPGLRKGNRVFLLSGGMRRSADGNDVLIEFTTQGARNQESELLRVSVSRRLYSYRQDLLPKLFAAQRNGQRIESQLLLVTLLEPLSGREASWRGETRSSVPRDPHKLPSLLEAEGGSSLAAVVGREGKLLEIEPGILFPVADFQLPADAQAGAVVRLTLGAGRQTRAELAIPSDLSYIADDGQGRAAVVLPKSPLLRQNALRELAEGGSPGGARGYTVAGLPGVEASASPSLSIDLLHQPHPKVVIVRRKATQVAIAPPGAEFAGGRLVADPRQAAAEFLPLSPGPGEGEAFTPDDESGHGLANVGWAQLSFADTSVEEVAENCARKTLHYSDATTGHWIAVGNDELAPATSLEGARGADEVVFATTNAGALTLRYPRAHLARFGFPADHAVKVLAEARSSVDRTFSVAGVAQGSEGPRGIWIELRPGHLVELTGEILSDSMDRPVSRLQWAHFAPGDRVQLSASQLGPRAIPSIRLESWRPGPRGAFGLESPQHRVLLPVATHSDQRGSLTLGTGRSRLTYPAARATRAWFPSGAAAWLNGTNELLDGTTAAGRDDVVLLGQSGGQLVAHGLPLAHPELAPADSTNWPDQWIRDVLRDEVQREQLLNMLGGSLAVTVEEAAEGPGCIKLIVSRRRQPRSVLPADCLVWARFLGVLTGQGGHRFVLEAGSVLYALPPAVLLPGLPSDLAPAVGFKDTKIWMHTDAHGQLHGGRPGATDDNDNDVVVMGRVALESASGGAGIVCEERGTSAYRWLPAAHVGWSNLSATDLKVHLTGHTFRAMRREDETLSLIGSAGMRRLFDRLHLGSTLRVEYLGAASGQTAQGLARIHLSEAIVEIRAAEARLTNGDSILAEVSRHRPGTPPEVQVVPLGRRRIILDLPIVMTTAMRGLARWSPVFDGPPEIPNLNRFQQYRAALAESKTSPGEVPGEEPAGVALVGALRALLETCPADYHGRLPLDNAADSALSTWWDECGVTILDEGEGRPEIDLTPALAACLLLDARGADSAEWARRAVVVSYQLGRYAERSMHTEALARSWLGRPDRWPEKGIWERLRRLFGWVDQGSMSDPRALSDPAPVHDFARSVLERTDPRQPGTDPSATQSPLAPIARSLLAAIGALSTGEHLQADSPTLSRLAGLGRGLTPGAGREASQPELLDCQRLQLLDLFLQVTGEACPLTLLPPVETV